MASRPLPAPVRLDNDKVDTEASEDPDKEEEKKTRALINSTPPWLISLVFHIVLLLILALIVFVKPGPKGVVLLNDDIWAEKIGEQLKDDSLNIIPEDPMDVPEPILTPKDLPPVNDPFAAPSKLDVFLDPNTSTSNIQAPEIGLALSGREHGMKQALLRAYGGTRSTEEAVLRGLEWLKRNQQRDGSWSLTGPYTSAATAENVTAATAMALLAFQGHGDTHLDGKYKDVVANGWASLSRLQDADGNFFHSGPLHHRLYSQAQATIAVCEIYGMTKDSQFREPAQRAIDYAVRIQDRNGGGWRYEPGQDTDTSVTGWFVMALQSGRMAGLEVPATSLEAVNRYLDRAAVNGGRQYTYKPGGGASMAMSAEGLLCRQYLGWKQDDPRLVDGLQLVSLNPINFREQNVYYWYYATQAAHHMEGEVWDKWNGVMREALPRQQVLTGSESGSWDPKDDAWGSHGGRLYTTCLCIYMLEVYYRHLPIYAKLYR